MTGEARCAIRQKNTQNILLCNEQHLHHLNTLRHNKVADYIHWTLYKHTGLQVTNKYYENTPKKIINVYHRLNNTSKPPDKKEKMCLMINIAIPDDPNVKKN